MSRYRGPRLRVVRRLGRPGTGFNPQIGSESVSPWTTWSGSEKEI